MITKHAYKNIEWVDLESPKEEEILPIARQFNLHPAVVSELTRPSQRSRADRYNDSLYLIFHFPPHRNQNGSGQTREIDFIVGKDFIITSHYEPASVILNVANLLETKSILDKTETAASPGIIFYNIMKELYEEITHRLDKVNKNLSDVEKEVFRGNEREMVGVLSKINKTLIDLKHPLKSHLAILESLDLKEEEIFGTSHEHYTEMAIGEYKRVWGILENNRELLIDLKETNDSLFSAKMNNVMKNLTIMSFLTFPLTLMTGIFSMNIDSTPIAELENGFWIILTIMGFVILFMISFFRFKRWI